MNLNSRVMFAFAFLVMVSDSYSGDLSLFNALYSGWNVESGPYEGAKLESFAKELLAEYADLKSQQTCTLGTKFSFDQIELHWIDAVIHPENANQIAEQVIQFAKENASTLKDRESLSLFFLLQELNRKREIVDLLKLFTPQVKCNVLRRIVAGDNDYLQYAREVSSLSSEELVVLWSAGDATASAKLSDVIDDYLVNLVMKYPSGHKQLLDCINDPNRLLAARGFAGLLTEEEKAKIASEILKGKYFLQPLAFVSSEELANYYLDRHVATDLSSAPESLQFIGKTYPDLVKERLSRLCASDSLKDVSIAICYYRRFTTQSVANDQLLRENVVRFINDTSVILLDGLSGWDLSLAALELDGSAIRVSPAVSRDLLPAKLEFLERLAKDMTDSCLLTFKARTLREAVLTLHTSQSR